MTPDEVQPLLSVEGLVKEFRVGMWPSQRTITAVAGISFDLAEGESLGIVGESGSGKTTAIRCILRLIDPTAGHITFDGTRVDLHPKKQVRHLYRNMQMVFQDPNSSLNPRMSVRQIIEEPLRLHLGMEKDERETRSLELLELVGLARTHLERYPGQLSGGQRQRVGVARAVSTHPKLVFLDEPTSSLDVSVRGQIMQLLRELQSKMKMSYVFISHDLGVVKQLCQRVLVMNKGLIVEEGTTQKIFHDPDDDYTKKLLAAVPSMSGYRIRRLGIDS